MNGRNEEIKAEHGFPGVAAPSGVRDTTPRGARGVCRNGRNLIYSQYLSSLEQISVVMSAKSGQKNIRGTEVKQVGNRCIGTMIG